MLFLDSLDINDDFTDSAHPVIKEIDKGVKLDKA
jgi:hypothetical protein